MKIFFDNIDAVIFDFDGTLYDNSDVPKSLILASPFEMFKMKKDRIARKKLKGKYFGTEEEYLNAYSNFVSPLWHVKKYLPLMVKVFSKKFKAHDGVEVVFERLRKNGVKTAILSDYSFVAERMTAIGLNPKIADFLFSSQSLGGLKPAKEIFLKTSDLLGVAPENVLVVGDRIDTDGEGALLSGMYFVQIKTRKNVKKEAKSVSEFPFVSWQELADVILKQ